MEAVGKRGQAARSLQRAIASQGDHLEAYSTLARLFAYESSSASSVLVTRLAFRTALRLRPAHHETLYNVGEWHSSNGRVDQATWAYGRAAAASPLSAISHLSLGESLQRQCRMAEASRSYGRAPARAATRRRDAPEAARPRGALRPATARATWSRIPCLLARWPWEIGPSPAWPASR